MFSKEDFLKLSFSEEQAKILAVLNVHGVLKASKVSIKANLERSLTYRTLDELIAMGLVEKFDKPGSVATFSVTHPNALKQFLNDKENNLISAKASLGSIYGDLLTSYNTHSEKPTVQFFEGEQGIQTVLYDSLSATEPIYTVANLESVKEYFWDINTDYANKRVDQGLQKQILVIGTNEAKKYFSDYALDTTDTRFLPNSESAKFFRGVMNVYDNKVAYITFAEDRSEVQSILIHNPEIYAMQRYLFETNYDSAQSL